DDFTHQAQAIGSQLVLNAGFNCLTPRVILQHATWDGRAPLNAAINHYLSRIAPRDAYYPGAAERHSTFMTAHPGANLHGDAAEGELPWTYIEGVDSAEPDDIVFTTEPFCSIMSETALEAPDDASFLDAAVDFVNENLWGTLCAGIVIHPDSLADPAVHAAYERAKANLRYGSICVNAATAFGYAVMNTSWGGHSGAVLEDIQSGIGVVNNLLLFDGDHIQKSVLETSFRSPLNQADTGDLSFAKLSEKLLYVEAQPSLRTLADLIVTAVRVS
ncbi:MAG: hypothetical protein AAF125_08535, partial [Chloroflexota bacterium]